MLKYDPLKRVYMIDIWENEIFNIDETQNNICRNSL